MTQHGTGDTERSGKGFFEVALNQRAHRELLADPVPDEDIERILGFKEALQLPEHIEAVATIAIGRPARQLGPPRRDPFAAHTHRDRYSNPW